MHQRRELPRKTHRLPNSLERCGRIVVNSSRVSSVKVNQLARSVAHVTGRNVQTPGPLGWRDMGWIPRQKQAAKTRWIGHKAAQWGNAFFDRWTSHHRFSQLRGKTAAQFVLKQRIASVFGFVCEVALGVSPPTACIEEPGCPRLPCSLDAFCWLPGAGSIPATKTICLSGQMVDESKLAATHNLKKSRPSSRFGHTRCWNNRYQSDFDPHH